MSLVKITLGDGILTVEPTGMHRWLALKSHISVPVRNIIAVDRELPDYGWNERMWKMFRVGAHVPGVYQAGTFHKLGGGTRWKEFWVVRHPENAIRILLRNSRYDALIVEVDDPDAWIARVGAAIGKETAT